MRQREPTNYLRHGDILLALIALTFHANPALGSSTTVSIQSEPAFAAMRECARDCLVWNGSTDLIGEFGCDYPYANECLCRADLAPQATKHLSTCCDMYCTGGADVDITSAIQVYYSYCGANGYDVKDAAEAAPATTTMATQTKGLTNTAAAGQQPATNTPAQTGSSNSGSSGSSGSGLSTGALIGILVSICSVIVSAIGVGVKVWLARRKKRDDREAKQYGNLGGNITNVHNYGGNFQMTNKTNEY